MTLKVSAPDGVKVYNVSTGKSLPDWVRDRKKRQRLNKDEEFRTRIELIQDFKFPTSCQRLKVSKDQQFIVAAGNYPPQTRVYDTANMSLKFSRHFIAEVVEFQVLSDDYSKLAFLCNDRFIRFQAKFGDYYEARIPKTGRDLSYIPFLAHLVVVGSCPEIYRLDLCEGRFYAPIDTKSEEINACGYCPSHGLFGCAGTDGVLECFDLRQRRSVGVIDAATACGAPGEELTTLRFDESGFNVAVGTSNGLVSVFDLRSQTPLTVKDHMYGAPIVDIKFQSSGGGSEIGGSKRVISADRHIIKVWDVDGGKSYTNVEPQPGGINDVCVWENSGLVMVACDDMQMQTFFIPSLGPAPKWCSFLEGLTEELEEGEGHSLYDDYRFVTRTDLEKLGLKHLVGTPMLKAYMHGFFIDNRLHSKAKSIIDPFAYETYRKERIQKKIDEERQSRIGLVRKLPKVNAKAAARILSKKGVEKSGGDEEMDANEKFVANPMLDSRFKAMFEDPAFAIDEKSTEFKLVNPGAKPLPKLVEEELLKEHFDDVDDADHANEDSDYRTHQILGDGDDLDEPQTEKAKKTAGREPRMLAARNAKSAEMFLKKESRTELEEMALEDRIVGDKGKKGVSAKLKGGMEFEYKSRRGGKKISRRRNGGR